MKSSETDLVSAREARDTLPERSYQKKSLKIWLKQTKKEVRWAIKIKKNKEWYKIIINFTLPSSSLKPLSIEYATDLYRGISAKNCSREERGQSETWVRLESLEQKLLPNKEWLPFFHNIRNKKHLFSVFVLISVVMILYHQVRCQYR